MNESSLVKKQIALIKRRGGVATKIHGGPYQRAGVSDILACYRGFYLALEAKTPKNKRGVTDLQVRFLKKVNIAGGVGEVVRSLQDVKDILDEVDRRLDGDG